MTQEVKNPNVTPTLSSQTLRGWQLRSASPVCDLAAKPRRAVSETTIDGTFISDDKFRNVRGANFNRVTNCDAHFPLTNLFSNSFRADVGATYAWNDPWRHCYG